MPYTCTASAAPGSTDTTPRSTAAAGCMQRTVDFLQDLRAAG